MPENRLDALLNSEDAEATAIAELTQLAQIYGAESRAAEIVAEGALTGAYRYNPGLGWMEWDGRRWDTDDVAEPRVIEAVRRYADTLERDYRAKAAAAEPARQALLTQVTDRLTPEQMVVRGNGRPRTPPELFRLHGTEDEKREMAALAAAADQAEMWLNLLSSGKINAIVKLCRGMDGIITKAAEFDAHPDLLNCHNGVVDLRTGELLPHDPALLITHLAGGNYDPDARSVLWDKALEAVHPECREWLQTRMGQSATGHTPDDDVLIVSAGGGENGKSAIKAALFRALGSYSGLLSHRVLTASPDAHPTELMDLRGLRFALLEETPEEGRLDTHRVKSTIGTPYITARRMRRDDVTFATTHSLWINTNFLPQVDSTDHGTWRRLKAMPWPYRFVTLEPGGQLPEPEEGGPTPKVGDPTLKPKLLANPTVPTAVLAWIVEGSKRWYANERVSPPDPAPVADATKTWRKNCDVGYQFATERLTADSNSFITREVFQAEFTHFLLSLGKREWSAQTINSRMPTSLAAAGIHCSKTPTEKAKVRRGDHESRTSEKETRLVAVQRAEARKAGEPDESLRMWRGVRFKTEADERAEALAESHLRLM